MDRRMQHSAPSAHRNSLEAVTPHMAKANLKSVEDRNFRAEIGRAIQRAIAIVGWTQKEAAGAMDRDVAQLSRWIAGTERPQLDALFAIRELRWPIVQCLAALDDGNELVTLIQRKSA